MYKDVLQKLNNDRKVDDSFIERLEKNGFEIQYGKYSYWDSQEYVNIGLEKVWLVEEYYINNSSGLRYRNRNEVVADIKRTIEIQKECLEEEEKAINEILPVI